MWAPSMPCASLQYANMLRHRQVQTAIESFSMITTWLTFENSPIPASFVVSTYLVMLTLWLCLTKYLYTQHDKREPSSRFLMTNTTTYRTYTHIHEGGDASQTHTYRVGEDQTGVETMVWRATRSKNKQNIICRLPPRLVVRDA